MEVLPWVFSSGWASGLNSYAVVLLLGLFGRFAQVPGVPTALMRTDILIAAAVLTAIDLLADKIPYLDSTWDTIHTVIRPGIAAAIGALMAGQAGDLNQAVAAGLGATTALASHAVKASLRAAINTSPEPASNIAISTAEDVAVFGVVSLSMNHPWAAAGIAAALLIIGAIAVGLLMNKIRQFRKRRRERQLERSTNTSI